MSELNKIALKIISDGKGILAADESNGTMTKRLEAVDVTSNSYSCVFDSKLTHVSGNIVKVVAWYDNEYGYCSRLIDLLRRVF